MSDIPSHVIATLFVEKAPGILKRSWSLAPGRDEQRQNILDRIITNPDFTSEGFDCKSFIRECAHEYAEQERIPMFSMGSESSLFARIWDQVEREERQRIYDEKITALKIDHRSLFEEEYAARFEMLPLPADRKRRARMWEKLQADDRFWHDFADHFSILDTLAADVRGEFPDTSITEQNGDRSFFVTANAGAMNKAKFFKNLVRGAYFLEGTGVEPAELVGLFRPLPSLKQGDIKRALTALKQERTDLDFDADHLSFRLSTMLEDAVNPNRYDDILGGRYGRGDRFDFRKGLVGQFRDAIHDVIKESQRSYERTRQGTLRKGVQALLNSFMREDRTQLKTATRDDFARAVDDVIDNNRYRWHSVPDARGREEAIELLWTTLRDIRQKFQDENNGWRQHRQDQRRATHG